MSHIVLLSESIGSGHERAATAVEEALRAHEPLVQITRLNLLDTFRPLAARISRAVYYRALQHSPKLWGAWYEWQREKEWHAMVRNLIRQSLHRDVGKWLQELQPDVIVCTHPIPALLIAEMKRQGLRVPLCTVVTDYDMHGYWMHPAVDLYCLPLTEMAEEIEPRIGDHAEVRVTGIPISSRFAEAFTLTQHRTTHERKKILISGGGWGLGVVPMVEQIAGSGLEADVTIVCGTNRSLFHEMKARCEGLSHVAVHGFSEQMESLMAQSDVLVTKPGGLTMSEALAMELPMVLYSPVGGQESRNGHLMARLSVALAAHSARDLTQHVQRLVGCDLTRQQMVRSMAQIRRPLAALDVAAAVLEIRRSRSGKQRRTPTRV
ncbi:MGDG synthase family glycosyltransferase [Tumebacillus permanentifrigoris]|uniref:Processive 1,2-diacylglycerol beta-glucosyltransferase n=1 Tax=Tumebacillus permanentifrigoris TaxID=378543 RepID=A0A316DB40_9BACL|nr:glycosyltransferase [Tumebacillus permanentifrigoris]PWK13121.1 processive 1,2-diacylglycerol beta-glucosyltransferase [Tumebacillus permanentifrigoris]